MPAMLLRVRDRPLRSRFIQPRRSASAVVATSSVAGSAAASAGASASPGDPAGASASVEATCGGGLAASAGGGLAGAAGGSRSGSGAGAGAGAGSGAGAAAGDCPGASAAAGSSDGSTAGDAAGSTSTGFFFLRRNPNISAWGREEKGAGYTRILLPTGLPTPMPSTSLFARPTWRMLEFIVALALVAVASAGPARATGTDAASAVAVDPSVAASGGAASATSERTLANGLRVVVREDHRSPVVVHIVMYRVGSMDESSGRTGIAHLLEHLMFKGTPSHPAGEFSRIVASMGGRENAFTSRDQTVYFQRIPARGLETVMRLEADRMANLSFDEEAFSREARVVMEERRLRVEDEPHGLLHETLMAQAFIASPVRT